MPDIRPVFNQVNIVSSDPEASLAFYRRLGVSIPDDQVWRTGSGIHHVNAKVPKTSEASRFEIDSAALARIWNTGWRDHAHLKGRVVVGFAVQTRREVDRLHAEMTAAGYLSLMAPYDAFWGARYAVIEDPDGLAVGLMSEMSDEYRAPPPEV
ncbi:VOC family protein [Reyranella sp.]|jgi:catechol 2,3-dioxygenase-like lactoylglutathione lyase family enzyme|uniref:VOC family protein n=1 Tax=Reyranella sp. TaxID=1929291 RepID=UPI002F92E6A3